MSPLDVIFEGHAFLYPVPVELGVCMQSFNGERIYQLEEMMNLKKIEQQFLIRLRDLYNL